MGNEHSAEVQSACSLSQNVTIIAVTNGKQFIITRDDTEFYKFAVHFAKIKDLVDLIKELDYSEVKKIHQRESEDDGYENTETSTDFLLYDDNYGYQKISDDEGTLDASNFSSGRNGDEVIISIMNTDITHRGRTLLSSSTIESDIPFDVKTNDGHKWFMVRNVELYQFFLMWNDKNLHSMCDTLKNSGQPQQAERLVHGLILYYQLHKKYRSKEVKLVDLLQMGDKLCDIIGTIINPSELSDTPQK